MSGIALDELTQTYGLIFGASNCKPSKYHMAQAIYAEAVEKSLIESLKSEEESREEEKRKIEPV